MDWYSYGESARCGEQHDWEAIAVGDGVGHCCAVAIDRSMHTLPRPADMREAQLLRVASEGVGCT